MFSNLTGWHALILLALVLLIFGATRLPALARSVGQSVRVFQKEVGKGPDSEAEAAAGAPAPAAAGVTSTATDPEAPGRD